MNNNNTLICSLIPIPYKEDNYFSPLLNEDNELIFLRNDEFKKSIEKIMNDHKCNCVWLKMPLSIPLYIYRKKKSKRFYDRIPQECFIEYVSMLIENPFALFRRKTYDENNYTNDVLCNRYFDVTIKISSIASKNNSISEDDLESLVRALFIQSVQLINPSSDIMREISNKSTMKRNNDKTTFMMLNTKNSCCFKHAVLFRECKTDTNVKFGILNHVECTTTKDVLSFNVVNRIREWYAGG